MVEIDHAVKLSTTAHAIAMRLSRALRCHETDPIWLNAGPSERIEMTAQWMRSQGWLPILGELLYGLTWGEDGTCTW